MLGCMVQHPVKRRSVFVQLPGDEAAANAIRMCSLQRECVLTLGPGEVAVAAAAYQPQCASLRTGCGQRAAGSQGYGCKRDRGGQAEAGGKTGVCGQRHASSVLRSLPAVQRAGECATHSVAASAFTSLVLKRKVP